MILNSLQAKSKERQWVKHQTSGELDDSKLIEGIDKLIKLYFAFVISLHNSN